MVFSSILFVDLVMYLYWFKNNSLKSRFRSKHRKLLTSCVISLFDHSESGNKLENSNFRISPSDIFMKHNLCFIRCQTFVTTSKLTVDIA